MADATYSPKVYRKQGGDELVVASGGLITVESGGQVALESGAAIDMEAGSKIENDGTQASNIAVIQATGAGNFTTGERAKFNSVLTALECAGILATS